MCPTSIPNWTGAVPPVHAPDCPDCAGADPIVVALLTTVAARWPAVPQELQARLEATLALRSPSTAALNRPGRLRRLLTRRVALIVGAAAVLALAAIVPTYFGGARPAVAASYAAALAAMQNAANLHIREYRRNCESGELEFWAETWYTRDAGIYRREVSSGCVSMFDSDVEWSVYPAQQLAVRRPSNRSLQLFFEKYAREKYLKCADRARHEPAGDTRIDGVPCRLFVAAGDAITTQPSAPMEEVGQAYLWVDRNGAVRRSEFRWYLENKWQVTSREEIEFGLPVDPALFSTQFPKTYRIIEPDKLLSNMFDLREADEVREVHAGTVSFHNTVRLPGNRLATTAVLRPTDRTAELLRRTTDERLRFGDWLPLELHLYGPCGSPERPAVVAELRDRSMHVLWLVFPSDAEHGHPDEVRFWFQVIDRSDDTRLSELAGLPWYVQTAQTIRLDGQPEWDLSNVANFFYDQLEEVAAFRPNLLIIEYGDPLSGWYGGAHAQGCDGGLALRASRQDFCDAFLKAWTKDD